MATPTIAVLIGSLRRDSFNRKLAREIERLAADRLAFRSIKIDDLPPYNQDEDDSPAPPVTRLRQEIAQCAGVLFVSPEYNRSVPGVLKNAIDHASRPYGKSVWAGKPTGVIGASVGAIGTALGQQHLRNILAYLDMPTMGQPEAFIHAKEGFFTQDGEVHEDSQQFLSDWTDAYVAWISAASHLR